MRQAGQPNLINLAAGVPSGDSVPTVEIREAFAKALTEESDRALGYQTPDGDYELRTLLAARFSKRGIKVSAEEMVTTTGCTQALHGMIRLLVKEGDVVACEEPAYYATLEILGDTGVAILPLPIKDLHGCDLDLVQTLFLQHRPKLLVLCSTLSNPSGATIPNSNRIAILEICRRTGTRILEDDIYGELIEREDLRPIRSFDDGSTVSYVTSFSKTVSAGIRAGVCIPGGKTDTFALLKSQQDMHSSTLCEVGFRKFLQQTDLDEHLKRLKEFNRRRREIAIGVIEQHFPPETKIWRPQGGFMLWVEVGIDLEETYHRCLEQNVAFGRGSSFYTQQGAGAHAMRLNCSRPPLDGLVAGIEILGKALSANP